MKNEHLCERVEIRDHEEYIELIELIRPVVTSIAIIQIYGYNPKDPVIMEADACMKQVSAYNSNNWPGTRTRGNRGQVFVYEQVREFYDYLYSIEAFFINESDPRTLEEKVVLTEFGINDIVFMDSKGNVLLYTTTHEGDIYLNEDYL